MTRLSILLAAATFALPQLPQPPPTFRAGTDIVEVDVVVQDRSGRFIADLKPEEFILHEEGAAQAIDLFNLVRGNVIAPTTPDAALAPALAAVPNAVRGPRIFVAFFDDDHLTPAGFKRVQAAALALFTR